MAAGNHSNNLLVWGADPEKQALKQVGALIESKYDFDLEFTPDDSAFKSRDRGHHPGMGYVFGEIIDASIIQLQLQLIKFIGDVNVSGPAFSRHIAKLGRKCEFRETDRSSSLWVELKLNAVPLGYTQENTFHDELEKINEVALALQQEIPSFSKQELLDEYKGLHELEPILNLEYDKQEMLEIDWSFFRETMSLLEGGVNIALCSPSEVLTDYAIDKLAFVIRDYGISLAKYLPPVISPLTLLKQATLAPGRIVANASSLNLGTNPYELSSEMQNTLRSLTDSGSPVIFTGSMEELQILSGGQGGRPDPLLPVIRRIHEISLNSLVTFSISYMAQSSRVITESKKAKMKTELVQVLKDLPNAEQYRILPMLTRRLVAAQKHQQPNFNLPEYVCQIQGQTESLGGLGASSRKRRPIQVQQNFKHLLEPGFMTYVNQYIFGQEAAIQEAVQRLNVGIQCHLDTPPCALFIGPPGSGKTQFSELMGEFLNIDYRRIDAASKDSTGINSLLSSGTGYVGSNKPGTLEKACKNHGGTILEISDLDHARPSVRSALADLFLFSLEGSIESGNGSIFSTSSIIFIFTINLPGDKIEKTRKNIGFNNFLTRELIRNNMTKEICQLFSGALLSRLGQPIIFDPFNPQTMARIIEKGVRKSIEEMIAPENLDLRFSGEIKIDERVGKSLLTPILEHEARTHGGRILYDSGLEAGAEKISGLGWTKKIISGKDLLVLPADASDGSINIELKDRR